MSRLRKRLAKMIVEALAERGINAMVDPDDLSPAVGWFRTSPQADCYIWEGFGHYTDLNLRIVLYGNTTMTQIVRSGKVTLSPDRMMSNTCFDVYDATGN